MKLLHADLLLLNTRATNYIPPFLYLDMAISNFKIKFQTHLKIIYLDHISECSSLGLHFIRYHPANFFRISLSWCFHSCKSTKFVRLVHNKKQKYIFDSLNESIVVDTCNSRFRLNIKYLLTEKAWLNFFSL